MARKPRTHNNPPPDVGGIDAERLRGLVQRLEHVDEEIDGLRNDRKDILAEAKSAGFNPKALTTILKIRKADPEKLKELNSDVDIYKHALAMDEDL